MADIAIFVDHENIFYSCLNNEKCFPVYDAVKEACLKFGDRVAFGACYADWDKMSAGIRFVVAAGLTPRMCPDTKTSGSANYQQRKSSLDNILAAEMMETLMHNPNIEVFVLVSGDRDYIPFINLLRREGKRVVVIGEKHSVARDLRESADSHIYLQDIKGALNPTRRDDHSNRDDYDEPEEPELEETSTVDIPEAPATGGFAQAAEALDS